MASEKADFFVSHTHVDERWAAWIAWQLEAAGYRTIIQAWDFTPGKNWALQMDRAATISERTLLVLSPDFLQATFPQPEWAAAFAQDPTGDKGKLVPVIVRSCEPTGLLKPIAPIRLAGIPEEEATRTLLAGVRRGRHKPTEAPPFPYQSTAVGPTYPRVCRLLLARSQNFVGRARELSQLEGFFARDSKGRPAVVVATGLGGIGKTLLASEFSYRHLSDYDVIWWTRASNRLSIESDLAALAGALRLPTSDSHKSLVEAALEYLSRGANWLLVFDNVKEPKDILRYVPRAPAGHVLITSQSTPWREVGTELPLGVMQPSESVQLVVALSGDSDEASAAELSEKLGHLPLAIIEAASFVAAAGSSLRSYLKLIQDGRVLRTIGNAPADYNKTVASVWAHGFREIAVTAPSAGNLMALISFLAPDDIPMSLLTCPPPNRIPPFGDAVAIHKAIAELRRFSFLQPAAATESFAVHRLVQSVGRDSLPAAARREWSGLALILTSIRAMELQPHDMSTWDDADRLMPHALSALNYADLHADNDYLAEPATVALLSLGTYLRERGRPQPARKLLSDALAINERAHAEGTKMGAVLTALGRLDLDEKKFLTAREHFQRALALAGATNDQALIASAENMIGLACRGLSEFPEALAHYQNAADALEKAGLAESVEAAGVLDNMAHVFRAAGAYTQARSAAEGALTLFEKSEEDTRHDQAIAHNLLALTAQNLGDLDSAESHQQKAIALMVATRGSDHPSVHAFRDNQASILHARGKSKEAVGLSRDAVNGLERLLGRDHAEAVLGRAGLGRILLDIGEFKEALELISEARASLERLHGEDDPEVVRLELDEAALLGKEKRLLEAYRLAERALAKTVARFGFSSRQTQRSLQRVHSLYLDAGVEGHVVQVTLVRDEILRAIDETDESKRTGQTKLTKGQVIETTAERGDKAPIVNFTLRKDQVPEHSPD